MRYMMLIYSKEQAGGADAQTGQREYQRHYELMQEAARKGVLVAAEPLAPTSTATTVRIDEGQTLITDGPFAETKEQLAGYYILECKNLDEAIEWAARIPTACKGGEGCVEIRPMPGVPQPTLEPAMSGALTGNG